MNNLIENYFMKKLFVYMVLLLFVSTPIFSQKTIILESEYKKGDYGKRYNVSGADMYIQYGEKLEFIQKISSDTFLLLKSVESKIAKCPDSAITLIIETDYYSYITEIEKEELIAFTMFRISFRKTKYLNTLLYELTKSGEWLMRPIALKRAKKKYSKWGRVRE